MNIPLLLNGIASSLLFIYLAVSFFNTWSGDKLRGRICKALSLIGLIYIVPAVLSFLWFFNFLKFSEIDFMILYSIVIVFETIILVICMYFILERRGFFYLFLFYLLVLVSAVFSISTFLQLFLITSYLLLLILFVQFTFRADVYRNVGYIGIAYASISLVFQLFLLIGFGSFALFSFFSTLLLLILLYFLIKDLRNYPLRPVALYPKPSSGYFLSFFKYFVFIVVLINFVFIGVVATHELGHFLVSKLTGCSSQRIVFEADLPHTEVLCGSSLSSLLSALGGVLIPVAFGLLFLFSGGRFVKDVFFLILGFNLVISFQDIIESGLSENIAVIFVVFGAVSILSGIILLVLSKTETYPTSN